MATKCNRAAATSIVVLVFIFCTALQVHATFLLESQSAVFNPTTGIVQFSITFNQPPDFFTVFNILLLETPAYRIRKTLIL
jgi:hypothetical protein